MKRLVLALSALPLLIPAGATTATAVASTCFVDSIVVRGGIARATLGNGTVLETATQVTPGAHVAFTGASSPCPTPAPDVNDPVADALNLVETFLGIEHPSGDVDISGTSLTATTFYLHDFDPPIDQWTCTYDMNAVSCTPHGNPKKFRCTTVSVNAQMNGLGTVTGQSTCGSSATASATSTGAGASANDSKPGGAVPFRCAATPGGLIAVWDVDCNVSP